MRRVWREGVVKNAPLVTPIGAIFAIFGCRPLGQLSVHGHLGGKFFEGTYLCGNAISCLVRGRGRGQGWTQYRYR